MLNRKIRFIAQHDQMDCGPACLAMVSEIFGRHIGLNTLREYSYLTKEGVSLMGIKEAAEKIGLEAYAGKISIKNVDNDMLPCILHWNQNHFVLLYHISKNRFTNGLIYHIADPAKGLIKIKSDQLKTSWMCEDDMGVALFLLPTPQFFNLSGETQKTASLAALMKHWKPYRKQFFQLISLLVVGSLLTLVFPFLTQKLIDNGVIQKNIESVTIILIAQLAFYLGNIVIEIIRNWITIKVGAKINVDILSMFVRKILRLPLLFFERKTMGDFNQRVQDQDRIELFLTSQSLQTLFSLVTFSVFFLVLLYYDIKILFIYGCLTVLSIIWSLYWLDKRISLDFIKFQIKSDNQNSFLELILGIQEIKINQLEETKRNEWELIQHKLFEINSRILRVSQLQNSGFDFINQLKNILVTFLTAYLVINNQMTLGVLLSVSYIIGQMNGPINQLISFFRTFQDARLSMERLNEVQQFDDEESGELKLLQNTGDYNMSGIRFKDVTFYYEGPNSPPVLKNINLFIPNGKVTAIVGTSGSGKSTLLKLLLRFIDPSGGTIFYGDENVLDISPENLRSNCGVVMQNGYIFSDTIERNIAVGKQEVDQERLKEAIRIANLESFIEELPLKAKTKIGASGNELSGGQRQRILIARAVYKKPPYLFLDEATSALDANNEKIIHDNLNDFFKGRTVVVIAHRLSTVKRADQIVVLKDGGIVEKGPHNELVHKKAEYYSLIKNQLELGA
ncbi:MULTISPECIES: peptidase domain-containing ABC transporter [Sphingobacterium]|uniref:peptidase domain-containing ABC transporter n=1 Tax=Sphingobacterium TaxID=28453 RepID=UPI0024A65E63|nr:peptidase domain-containing ABC transporter [Sphingobacterium thalpophilum]